jgi:hypothetical protein
MDNFLKAAKRHKTTDLTNCFVIPAQAGIQFVIASPLGAKQSHLR